MYYLVDVNAISVEITGNRTGLLGYNGTDLKCSYTQENTLQVFTVSFMAFNKCSTTFEPIATYIQDKTPLLNTQGQYLKGRVTLTPITQSSAKAVMTFDKLMCIDDTFYQCSAYYLDTSGYSVLYSNNISISVQGRYRTTTTTQDIAEGDNITVVCTGDVGKPPVEHVFQKHLNGQIVAMQDTVTTTSISEMSENCSYYRTSNIVFKVTAFDNNAVIRCVVHSSMADPDMYIDTEPLRFTVNEVSEPTITKYPNKPYYIVGENTSILLTCKSDGNPKPHYQWYKENDNMLISTNERLTITDMNVRNSGIYTCNVSNTFNGDTHRNARHVQLNIMNKENLASSTTVRTSVCNKTSVIKQSNNENTAVIVVGAVCGSIILVLCVILFGVLQNKTFRCFLRRKNNDISVDYVNTVHQQDPSLYEGVGQTLDEHNYEQLSRMEHVYNNTNFSSN
ncbi:unnamed protein product [Mytilus edulis]|uniref:Ig-like domain-containing protein n=1 Tax=Mytilus edulis TaxID=6550 RepID=A0A8S3R3S2_MYTED|nr:unnamed protein product [Mytilus edulis]